MPFTGSGERGRFRPLLPLFLSASFAAGSATFVHADIDLTGRWRAGAGSYADIVQTGSDVTVAMPNGMGTLNLTGTFDQTTLTATQPGVAFLTMVPYGDGTTLDGTISFNTGMPNSYHRRLTRCECYDGGESAGDGCDAECRVEPCFACTPEPSVCTPSADAAPCDDRNDCTSGETCSSGACGNGALDGSCVNLTGQWRVFEEIPDFESRSDYETALTQRSGVVTSASDIGNVDPATGAMDLIARGGSGWCTVSADFEGTATLDNRQFSGTGIAYASGIHSCLGLGLTVRAKRCDPVEGCGLTDCSGADDGTPCADSDPCTIFESCRSGVCVGAPKCQACETCDINGTCYSAPNPSCLVSTDTDSSKLQIAGLRIGFTWARGEAFDAAWYDPAGPTEFTLCMFGGNDALFYKNGLSALAECGKPPCWKAGNGSWSYRNDEELSPVTSLKLKSGAEGRSRVQMKMKGWLVDNSNYTGLEPPVAPLALPIRVQLQSDTGACFEAEFDSGGEKRNEDGTFKANGGALP